MNPHLPKSESLVTKLEAARELRFCQRTIENLMRARVLSYIKIGRAVRISRASIEALKAAHTVKANE